MCLVESVDHMGLVYTVIAVVNSYVQVPAVSGKNNFL